MSRRYQRYKFEEIASGTTHARAKNHILIANEECHLLMVYLSQKIIDYRRQTILHRWFKNNKK